MKGRWLTVTALVVAVTALAASPGRAAAAQTKAQRFFSEQLQNDPKVGAEVKRHLTDGTWRVDRDIGFSDLTGDGKTDAVVRVYSGTAAQDVAAYIFSSREGAKLKVVFAKEGLYRVTFSTRRKVLRLFVPSFEAGDPTCCPSHYVERIYRWRVSRFVLVSTRRSDAKVPIPK